MTKPNETLAKKTREWQAREIYAKWARKEHGDMPEVFVSKSAYDLAVAALKFYADAEKFPVAKIQKDGKFMKVIHPDYFAVARQTLKDLGELGGK